MKLLTILLFSIIYNIYNTVGKMYIIFNYVTYVLVNITVEYLSFLKLQFSKLTFNFI